MNSDRRFAGEVERLRSPERIDRLEVNRVVDLALDGIRPQTMLDIGTGSGLFAEAFAAKGLKVSGVDLREDMLEAARQYVPQGEFRAAHMESLPFPDAAFDLAFLGLVLHEADSLSGALQEAFRVVKQRVVVLEWPYQVGDFGPPQDHRLLPNQVIDAARQAGFDVVQETVMQHLTLFRLDKRLVI